MAALEYARKGDTLVAWRLDRLGRSLPDLVALVAKLESTGVQLESLQEKIDTGSATGKLVFHLFAALAEIERNLIRERTNAWQRLVHELHIGLNLAWLDHWYYFMES